MTGMVKRVTIQVRASAEDKRILRRLEKRWSCGPSEAIRRAIRDADTTAMPFAAQLASELAIKEQEREE